MQRYDTIQHDTIRYDVTRHDIGIETDADRSVCHPLTSAAGRSGSAALRKSVGKRGPWRRTTGSGPADGTTSAGVVTLGRSRTGSRSPRRVDEERGERGDRCGKVVLEEVVGPVFFLVVHTLFFSM